MALTFEQRMQAMKNCHEISGSKCTDCPAFSSCSKKSFYYIPFEQFERYFDNKIRYKKITDDLFNNEKSRESKKILLQMWEVEKFIENIENPKIKTIFELRFYENFSYQLIACRTGYCSEHTPKRKIKNILKMAEMAD